MVNYTEKLKLPHTELIVGRSGSGKTHYLVHQLESILKNNPKLIKIYVICPTIQYNKAYKNWKLPNSLSKKVQYIGCHQDSVIDEVHEIIRKCKLPANLGDEDNPKNIIVLDDCAQGTDIKKRTGPIVAVAFGARHIGVGMIIITQQLTSIFQNLFEIT